jgi:alkanesulfonate monooxygenase SsuD/methylene tetrahydromethanopterin reductase-like flavin-dependent oxidoreductase (luciferase family)
VILGRGSFTESFPLFGFDLGDYEALFEEKLALFAELRSEGPVTFERSLRAPLRDQRVYPTTAAGIPTWVGVGGSQQSVVRAASYGFPLMIAIIGGSPAAFAPLVELYHRALEHFGHATQPVGVHSPGYVGATDAEAMAELYPHAKVMRDRIGRERGWPPMTERDFARDCGPDGAWYVGSPQTVAEKIARTVKTLGLTRFDLKYSGGTMPHELSVVGIERYGTEVLPRVHELLA